MPTVFTFTQALCVAAERPCPNHKNVHPDNKRCRMHARTVITSTQTLCVAAQQPCANHVPTMLMSSQTLCVAAQNPCASLVKVHPDLMCRRTAWHVPAMLTSTSTLCIATEHPCASHVNYLPVRPHRSPQSIHVPTMFNAPRPYALLQSIHARTIIRSTQTLNARTVITSTQTSCVAARHPCATSVTRRNVGRTSGAMLSALEVVRLCLNRPPIAVANVRFAAKLTLPLCYVHSVVNC